MASGSCPSPLGLPGFDAAGYCVRFCALLAQSSVAVPMTKGALLVVDNYLALHGRLGFKPGTPRQSLVSILYA